MAEEDEAAARAALSALVASFPEGDEVPALAALVLGAFPDAGVEGALNRRPLAPASGEAPAASSAAPSASALLRVGAAQPNPSAGRAYLPFELATEATVEAVLYDALGRRVALLASGRYGAGRHALTLDPAAAGLPAGVYVAYITADVGGGAPAVAVRRITMTR
ncbi:MAG TPA: hypothetical protein VK002_05755 [Rubricoccaceae bacterium]|nr:hypothetical protein [Rubricoccaceae bacterium]